MNDPIDKLITQGPMPLPQPHKRRKGKGYRGKDRRIKSLTLSQKQANLVEAASKRLGFSQYIRNLIRRDIEAEGKIWPNDLTSKSR